MSKIIEIKSISEDKNKVTLELNSKELSWIEGKMEKMHLFSEDNLKYKAKLVKRGKRDSTKYFLLPKEFRKNVNSSNNVKSTVIESKIKSIFIFEVSKY